jgi:hypothetical protein
MIGKEGERFLRFNRAEIEEYWASRKNLNIAKPDKSKIKIIKN